MTPQEFAEKITGQEYPFELEDRELAKHHMLIVLWGQSDDLLEVDGLIRDECSAWEGRTARFGSHGFLEINEDGSLQSAEPTTVQECREIVENFDSSFEVKAEWCPGGTNLSWRITADTIPSERKAVFVVVEDGEPMCEGLVVRMPVSQTTQLSR
ncbi:hypothetical protein QGP82_14555 [Leptothoe sp. LEGE 181152]|nr:hypothetical protein [Leptothoe sp. LEGE 181152]